MTQRLLNSVVGFVALLCSTGSATGQTLPTVAEGYTVRLFVGNLPGPTGIAFDSAGNLIVCTWDGGLIYSIDPQGTKKVLNPGSNLPHVWQPTVTPDGRIFVTAGGSSRAGRIFELVAGAPVLFYEGEGALGISWHNDELYFTQSPTGSVLRTALNSLPTIHASGLEVGIAGLLFGPDGHLFVANDDNNTIFRIDSTGAAEPYLTGLPRPEMIELDGAGNLCLSADQVHLRLRGCSRDP